MEWVKEALQIQDRLSTAHALWCDSGLLLRGLLLPLQGPTPQVRRRQRLLAAHLRHIRTSQRPVRPSILTLTTGRYTEAVPNYDVRVEGTVKEAPDGITFTEIKGGACPGIPGTYTIREATDLRFTLVHDDCSPRTADGRLGLGLRRSDPQCLTTRVRLVPDLQSPVLYGAGDPDPRSARVEALRGLVDRLFPDRTQVVDVDDGIVGQRDPCPAEAELQLDVDHRVLKDCSGQVKVDLPVLRFDLENSGYPPRAASAEPSTLASQN
jgi:hypothetical protein